MKGAPLLIFPVLFAFVWTQAGPFRMSLYQLGVCEPVGNIIYPTKIKKISRTSYAYSCNCTLGDGLNDDQSLIFNLAKFGNGGWKPNYFTLQYKKVCRDAWPIIENSARNLLSNNHMNITCPIPPGNYEIKDYHLDIAKYERIFPILPYGRFRIDVDFRKKSKRSGCIRLFVDIDPKKKNKG